MPLSQNFDEPNKLRGKRPDSVCKWDFYLFKHVSLWSNSLKINIASLR